MIASKMQLIQTLKVMMSPHERALKKFNATPGQITAEETVMLCKTINALETYQKEINKLQDQQ